MNRTLTIPNIICLFRLFASPLLLPLAWNGYANYTLALFVVLTLSDFIDGKLARWLDQRSEIGPRLDSFADAAMYGCLTLALVFLRGQALSDELVWILLALVSYLAATSFAIAKFGRVPSYHTRTAKSAWLVVAIAAVTLLIGGSPWPLRLAMVSVMVANVESSLLTHRLSEPINDIHSIFSLPERS